MVVCRALNMSFPVPHVFSNPPPAPPWSKQSKNNPLGPSLSRIFLVSPAYRAIALSQPVSSHWSPRNTRGFFSRSLAMPSWAYMYEAILPPRVEDRPPFTEHSLSGTIMMFQRLPDLSVMVLVIALVMVMVRGGTCFVKSTPSAF
ncbi:MAG: hypothetical protein ACD_23C01084G0001 [uncultured bacterium]|nr:MAG: hypothetical protein ACD_23C01084G0001 [uncultured bacterium]